MTTASLSERMLLLLKETLADSGAETNGLTVESPLIGADAVITSLGLVSLIGDIEMALEDDGIELTLVSEEALSRTRSPFRNISVMSEYVLELMSKQS